MMTGLIFFPLAGILVLCAVPRGKEILVRQCAIFISGVEFLASLRLYFAFQPSQGYQFASSIPWIPSIGASYHVAVDGISLFLFLLTTFLTFLAVIFSARENIHQKTKEYFICILLLETCLLGVFSSLDLLLFYVFWEAVLIPMIFLIGVWGHERRIYAAIKFLLYTMSGSIFLLIGILTLYFLHGSQTGIYTFDLLKIFTAKNFSIPFETQKFLFLCFAVSFAIKVPLFPFHTWLPDAHVEAPTAGSVLLAGVLLKMGTYGFLRFCLPLFPEACIAYAPFVSKLAVCGILYGALVSWVQPDFKKLVAYSSVSHLGFVVLGLFAFTMPALSGSYLQMINHGISTGALFFIVGMLYDRRRTRQLSEFGGLSKIMPFFSVCFLITSLASIGLPGLNGFVGEFLILSGTYLTHRSFAVLACFGVVLSAVYMLNAFQKVMQGEVTNDENKNLHDLNLREKSVLAPLLLLMILLGVFPALLLRKTELPLKETLKPIERILTPKPAANEVTWNNR